MESYKNTDRDTGGLNKMKNSIRNGIALYFAFAKVTFLTQLEYRGQFFIRMISKIVSWSTGFVMILVLLNQFERVGSWGMYEILFLYSLEMLSSSLARTFFMSPFTKLPQLIIRGELDQILVRPVNPLIYLICTKVSAGYISNYIMGIIVINICIEKLQININFCSFIWLVLVVLGATLIQAAGFMITSIPAFWILKSDGLMDIFYRNMISFINYPISIYNRGIQILLTFILPYAFINYYPSQFFLGKQELFHPFFQFMTPFVGFIVFIGAYLFWRRGLNSYQGTGS